MEIWS